MENNSDKMFDNLNNNYINIEGNTNRCLDCEYHCYFHFDLPKEIEKESKKGIICLKSNKEEQKWNNCKFYKRYKKLTKGWLKGKNGFWITKSNFSYNLIDLVDEKSITYSLFTKDKDKNICFLNDIVIDSEKNLGIFVLDKTNNKIFLIDYKYYYLYLKTFKVEKKYLYTINNKNRFTVYSSLYELKTFYNNSIENLFKNKKYG